ncbi:MAG: hypothetical protein JNM25_09645 [Planctomycetes bacterium]|nr:hypothetical protein [Planctomycetota bacterium]
MKRILLTLTTVTLCAAPAATQCFDASVPGTLIATAGSIPGDDAISTTFLPLGFKLVLGGAALPAYTHFRVGTNGWLFLSDGVSTAGMPFDNSYGSTGISNEGLRGSTGYHPLIAPYWGDLVVAPTGGIYFHGTPGASCRISWIDVYDYNLATLKSFQVELFATGEIRFGYSAGMNVAAGGSKYVAVSSRNGVALPAVGDFVPGPATTTTGLIYQTFPYGMFDLGGRSITFAPDGSGGWREDLTCEPASHTSYGAGCYDFANPAQSFYQFFPDSALAAAVLQGNAMMLAPTATGYTATWLPGGATAYVIPTGLAAALPRTDDGYTVITPSRSMPVPGGTAPQLTIEHNGNILVGNGANHSFDWTPTSSEMTSAPLAGFYSWHDFNDTEPGSGAILTEELGDVLYVTWDSVESFATPELRNPSTMQFQIDLATGVVTCLWVKVDNNTTANTGSAFLVGYTGPAAAPDPGPIALAMDLPITTANNLKALKLTADVPPICTPALGTIVTYVTSNMPEFAPGTQFYVGALALSFGPVAPFDLASIGAPGCFVHIVSVDGISDLVAMAPEHLTPIFYPPGTPAGLRIYAQSVALFDADHPLPNGQNAFGMVTSNAIESLVAPF